MFSFSPHFRKQTCADGVDYKQELVEKRAVFGTKLAQTLL
jgi:hypothetical protein